MLRPFSATRFDASRTLTGMRGGPGDDETISRVVAAEQSLIVTSGRPSSKLSTHDIGSCVGCVATMVQGRGARVSMVSEAHERLTCGPLRSRMNTV